MAEFSVNVVTTAGLALIARAAAASQLIYTRVLSDADAMTAAAAALATPADFSGPEGTILAASATDVSCRVVGRIGNQSTATSVKTFAVCAKIDGDASDVVVAVLSDDAEIPIPDTSSPITGVEIGFLINIASADTVTVQVTGAGSVTFGDIERFVSCHKAGDPTAGEQQTILGDKTFSDDVDIAGGLGVVEDAVFSADVEINGGLSVDGAASFSGTASFGYEIALSGPTVPSGEECYFNTVQSIDGATTTDSLIISWPDHAADEVLIELQSDKVKMGGDLEARSLYIETSAYIYQALTVEGVATFTDPIVVAASSQIKCVDGSQKVRVQVTSYGISIKNASETEIASIDTTSGIVSASGYNGAAPSIVSSALQVPIGGIVGVCPSGVTGWAQDVPAGTEVTITAGLMPAAAWDCANSRWGVCPSGRTIPAGTYTCVTGWDYNSSGSTYGLVLLCRVS